MAVELYGGTAFGTVQSTFYDQMATALAGDILSTDDNLIDGARINEANGVDVGLGVVESYTTTQPRAGVNNVQVALPSGATAATDFYGVVLRASAGWTRTTGVAYIPYDRMAPILRPGRAGGRVWVTASDTITAGDLVYLVRSNAVAGNTRSIGSFTNAAITDGMSTDTVQLANASFRSAATTGQVVLIEFMGKPGATAYGD